GQRRDGRRSVAQYVVEEAGSDDANREREAGEGPQRSVLPLRLREGVDGERVPQPEEEADEYGKARDDCSDRGDRQRKEERDRGARGDDEPESKGTRSADENVTEVTPGRNDERSCQRGQRRHESDRESIEAAHAQDDGRERSNRG